MKANHFKSFINFNAELAAREIGAYRYGFNGMESELASFEGAYDFGARILDTRLGRWLSVDPILKTMESPYAGFSNNPLLFVDKDGQDTLVVHALKLTENNGGQTVIIKITFSIVQEGIETPLDIKVGEEKRADEVYFTVPISSWIDGNIWIPESGDQKMIPIRFESYQGSSGTNYKNSIRIKYVDKTGKRIMAHKGSRGNHSVGCNLPTLEIPNDEGQDFKTSGSQDILDGIRELFDQYIPSSETTDKFGRKVQEPSIGYDFITKTNSEAPDAEPQNDENLIQPIPEKK